MKTQSTNLVHKINNHLGVLLSSFEALEENLHDHDYLKEVISEICRKKDDYRMIIDEIKEKITGQEA